MKSIAAASLLCLPLILAGLPPSAATELPASIKSSGILRVAVVPNYPPLEYRDPATNELTGFDVDLARALATKLGIKPEWQETAFEQMLPALTTGRVDAIISGMTDLASRHATSGFVDYLRSGPQFIVLASRAGEFKDMPALCGKTVGASRRTSFPSQIEAWSQAHCGSNPIKVIGTDGSADARTQLRQQRIDAAVQGNETIPYVMGQEPNTYLPVGEAFGGAQLTGIAIAKDDVVLQNAIASALDDVIADGTYRTLLDKWHLSAQAIEKASINAGQ
jgi:polar amino acid transport system substrate-binding protein